MAQLPPGATNLGKVVEEHPLFDEIYERLRHHQSPDFVLRTLDQEYSRELRDGTMKALPAVRSVRNWIILHMPPQDFLPPSQLDEKLENIELKIDLFQSLQKAYQTAENRLVKHLETEETMAIPVPGIDKAYETLLRIGDQVWRIGQDLGLYPRAVDTGPHASSRAMAQASVFIVDGTRKTVQQMSDGELELVETALDGNPER